MFLFKSVIFLNYFLVVVQLGAVLTPLSVEDCILLKTEKIIRDVTKALLHSVKLEDKPAIKSFSTAFKFLTFTALKDGRVLKKIFNITRLNNKESNKTVGDFIATVDVLLLDEYVNIDKKEDFNVFNILDDKWVVNHVRNFIDEYIDLNTLKTFSPYSNALQNTSDKFLAQSGRRIFKGKIINIRKFPFMVAILVMSKFYCAGSIIHSDLILTAASCLQLTYNNRFFHENPSMVIVRVGSTQFGIGGETIPVSAVYFHPKYNPRNLNDNICVLRLIRHLSFTKRKKKIKKIDFDRNANQQPENVDQVTIIGWGPRINKLDSWNDKLSFAVLPIFHWRECRSIYGKEYVSRQHFCAGFISISAGACNRDLGGPGIISGILVGVISFGPAVCGAKNSPTVFTKVGFYADWIEEIIEEDVPTQRARTTTEEPDPIDDNYLRIYQHQPKKTELLLTPPIPRRKSTTEESNYQRTTGRNMNHLRTGLTTTPKTSGENYPEDKKIRNPRVYSEYENTDVEANDGIAENNYQDKKNYPIQSDTDNSQSKQDPINSNEDNNKPILKHKKDDDADNSQESLEIYEGTDGREYTDEDTGEDETPNLSESENEDTEPSSPLPLTTHPLESRSRGKDSQNFVEKEGDVTRENEFISAEKMYKYVSRNELYDALEDFIVEEVSNITSY